LHPALDLPRFLIILPSYLQEKAKPDVPVSELAAWACSHMGPVKSGVSFNPDAPAQAYSDPTVHAKVRDYTEAVKAVRGSDTDVRTEPLDTEVIVRLGQGRKNGRLWMADGADSSVSAPSLSDVRARSTCRSLPIRARPTPTLSRVDELTVILVSLIFATLFIFATLTIRASFYAYQDVWCDLQHNYTLMQTCKHTCT
jgi:hypothetical protein